MVICLFRGNSAQANAKARNESGQVQLDVTNQWENRTVGEDKVRAWEKKMCELGHSSRIREEMQRACMQWSSLIMDGREEKGGG